MADDNDARLPVLPGSASELDGWNVDDTKAWLDALGRPMRQMRLAVGLGLWKLREQLAGDERAYGLFVASYAERHEIDVRTLRRWRALAETEFELERAPRSLARTADTVSATPAPAQRKPKPVVETSSREAKPAAGRAPVDGERATWASLDEAIDRCARDFGREATMNHLVSRARAMRPQPSRSRDDVVVRFKKP